MTTKTLPLDDIRLDGQTQSRVDINDDAVREYCDDYLAGCDLPPLGVVFDGSSYWLWDGFHRYHGRKRAGRDTVEVVVTNGTVEDARWLAVGANRTHGLRRSNADKRRAVEMALALCPDMSDRQIADHVGVDHKTVGTIRKELAPTGEIPQSRTGKDGRTIDTTNIGKARITTVPDDPTPASIHKTEPTLFPSPAPEPPRPSATVRTTEPEATVTHSACLVEPLLHVVRGYLDANPDATAEDARQALEIASRALAEEHAG